MAVMSGKASLERLRELEAIVREHIERRELAYMLRRWLSAVDDIDAMQTQRDDALIGVIPEPESW